MLRVNALEVLDTDGVPDDQVIRAYRDLARIHRLLGDTRCIIRAIRRDPLPVRSILDIGCATGSVLEEVRRALRVEAVGVDLRPRRSIGSPVPIVRADAVCQPLPPADVAFAMHVGHHLTEADLIGMIRNVGRFCRRFIMLDLVRHPLPLALFRLFVAPHVSRITAGDGARSIRRSFTPAELRRITSTALDGGRATFRQSVAPLFVRQVVDIAYKIPPSPIPPSALQ